MRWTQFFSRLQRVLWRLFSRLQRRLYTTAAIVFSPRCCCFALTSAALSLVKQLFHHTMNFFSLMNSEPCSFWVLLLAARLLNVMAALQAVTVFMDGCCVPEVVLIGRAGWFTQWYISPGFQNSFLIRTRWEERGELTGGAICEECISHQTRLTLCS